MATINTAQLASAFYDLVAAVHAETTDETTFESDLKTAFDNWVGLGTSNAVLAQRMVEVLARIDGVLLSAGPPDSETGSVGAFAFDTTNQAFYGPKDESGWGDPNYITGVTWSAVSGKPSTFAPSAHQHAGEDITSGTIAAARIGALAASIITSGTFDALRIPALDAAKIASGVLDVLRIPDLAAEKLTSGTLDALRIPALDAAKIASGILDALRIPDLAAEKLTSGTLDAARVPGLSADKITSNTFHNDRVSEANVTQHDDAISPTFDNVRSTPTTLAGYGITDGKTAAQITSEIQAAVAALIDGAPGAIDTLNELAAALGDDPDFATTVTNALASKLAASVWVAATASNDGYMSQEQAGKLAAIQVEATKNATDAALRARSSHTGSQAIETISGLTDALAAKLAASVWQPATASANGYMTLTQAGQLDGIATGATANETDAHLLARANHTGSQAIATISGLQGELDAKVALANLPFASVAEYTSTDATTDLADVSGAVIQWNTSRSTDSAINIGGTNDTELSFDADGKYRVSARLSYEDTSAENTDVDNSVGLFFKLNGTGTGGQGIGSVVANSAGANEGQVWFEQVINITDYENQVITVCTQRLSGADELYLRSGESTLIVEKIGGKSSLLAAQDISDIEGLVAALAAKANGTDVYTKTEVTDFLAGKTSVTDMTAALAARVTTSAFMATLGDYSTTTAITALLADKLDASARGATDGVASLSGGKVPIGELPTGTSTNQLVTLDSSGKLPSGVMPDGVGGGGIDVQSVQASAFSLVADKAYPVDLQSGAITLSGLLTSPVQGQRVELYDAYGAASGSNTLTIPADDPLNAAEVDLILTAAGFRMLLEYVDATQGYLVSMISGEDVDDYRRDTVSQPAITAPTDSATGVLSDQTITGNAFAMLYGTDTHSATDWQLSESSDFSTVEEESLDDASNLTSWTPAEATWMVSTTYYVRCRYKSAGGAVSAWSDTISFTTASAFLTDASALALIALMTTEPSQDRKVRIHDFHKGITDAGLWSKIRYLFVPKAHDAQAAKILWKSSGGTVDKLDFYNAPVFTADTHLAGDASAAYVEIDGGRTESQDTVAQPVCYAFGIEKLPTGGTGYFLGMENSSNRTAFRANSGNFYAGIARSSNSVAPSSPAISVGDLWVIQQINATTLGFWKNGVNLGTTTVTQTARSGQVFRFFAYNSVGTNYFHSDAGLGLFMLGSVGATLTDGEVGDLNTLWQAYRSGMGAD